MIQYEPDRTNTRSTRRCGFTLVELLVSISIMGILGGMVAIALNGANRQSRQARAVGLINELNLTMLQLYEEESEKSVGLDSVWTAEAASQSQLIWKRDWLRASLPNSKADIDAGWNPAAQSVLGIPYLRANGAQAYADLFPASRRHNMSEVYRSRVVQTYRTLSGNLNLTWADVRSEDFWTEEYQSAECLYLIFATRTLNGEPLLDQLRTQDVADVDGDLMPEVVDTWGTPVEWMRWPVGYYLQGDWSNPAPDALTVSDTITRLGDDPLDLLRGDPRQYLPPGNTSKTFYVRPMIISAGPDQKFDMARYVDLPPDVRAVRENIAFNQITPPTLQARRLPNGQVNNSQYASGLPFLFPDPYFTLQLAGNDVGAAAQLPLQRLGAVTDLYDGDGVDDSADNIYPTLGL